MMRSNLTRRAALAGGAIAAVGSVARPARAQVATKTFVLVAGAAGGGWQWRRVADRLERQGCKVFAPTLTGLGERSHLLSKDVGLDTHITDVVNVVRWESLEGICLVAHSYAGWPCGAALDRVGDKVASVVWLDAFKPEDGRALIDLVVTSARQTYEDAAANGELGMPLPPRLSTASVNPRDQTFLTAKLTPQPIATYMQTLHYGGGLERIAKKTYVRLPAFPNPLFDKAFAACKADKSWSTAELADCGHYAMFDAPERLAALLLHAA
ncbi:MAG: alpha/beta fold hydrolase [Roseiarcus sp.]|jgi:pimeloyl-ACP methyl ester carboxylesterase